LSTIALPGVFPVFSLGEWELVDGGTLNPVPVLVARSLAPGTPVAAVVLSTPLGSPARALAMPLRNGLPGPLVSRLNNLRISRAFDNFMRGVDIGGRQVAELRLQLEKPDVIIRPDVYGIGVLDQVNVHELADRGEAAARAALPELKRATSWPTRLHRRVFGDHK
jgi:NTE family protein